MEGCTMTVSLRDEVRTADFGDKRINYRYEDVVEVLGESPNNRIPAATKSRAAMEPPIGSFVMPR